MTKIVTIIGARPQFIKAAMVSRVFREQRPAMREVLAHTGQHYDANMLDVFFDELDIPRPDYHLGIGGGTHGQNTGRMIEAIEGVLLQEKPDWVLVYGDTDSTLAGTLAAAKLHVPVAHVEAGLRSFNRRMPEEINRVLTDHAADLLFTPTDTATRNWTHEGITGDQVQQVGDVMYYAALYYGERAEPRSRILATLELESKRYILATVHGSGISSTFAAGRDPGGELHDHLRRDHRRICLRRRRGGGQPRCPALCADGRRAGAADRLDEPARRTLGPAPDRPGHSNLPPHG